MINLILCLQNILEFQYQYEDSDVLNVAVSGAKIRDLPNEIANLTNQLQELNDVCTNSHPHTLEVLLTESIAWRTMSLPALCLYIT